METVRGDLKFARNLQVTNNINVYILCICFLNNFLRFGYNFVIECTHMWFQTVYRFLF